MQPSAVRLSGDERGLLAGEAGPAMQLAMRVVVGLATAERAERLIAVTSAHVDGCLYHGTVGLDFAERLAAGGGEVAVPTTLNVSSLDLLHPEIVALHEETRSRARRLMNAYVALGCRPTWTCAPYQLARRPAFGEHVAWAESNAIVFANSVLGARTARYGDFIDICAALTGRVPYAGLHVDAERRAALIVELAGVRSAAFDHDELYALVGHAVGLVAGTRVPAIVGLPPTTTEDQLRALGAAAASSGAVVLYHAVGVTPEASTLADCTAGRPPADRRALRPADLRAAWQQLSTTSEERALSAVSLGTPHLSLAELERLAPLLEATAIHPGVTVYVATGRDVWQAATERGWRAAFEGPGIQPVADTCTYVTPILRVARGAAVMTNSAKWAWYAPANLGVDVAFGTLEDCLESAAAGRVVRRRPAWLDD